LSERPRAVIAGTGSCLPPKVVHNESFLVNEFRNRDGKSYDKANAKLISDFERITGITERRYVSDDLVSSDIAYLAAKDALESSGTDRNSSTTSSSPTTSAMSGPETGDPISCPAWPRG
jgi:3-oxoacyl-[acyl-carrier-protein] synthase-3